VNQPEGQPPSGLFCVNIFRQKLGGSEFKVMRLGEASLFNEPSLDQPRASVEYLRPQLEQSIIYRPDVENFTIIHLTVRRKPIGFEIITTGTLDTCLVHAREVFRSAIIANSAAIILVHNHPSGDPTPSGADITITRNLMRAGELLKIEVLDHIIFGDPQGSPSFHSLKELGYFT
jgi:DNA repair protein RadC